MRAEVPLYSEKNTISGPSVPSVGTNNPRSMCVCVCVCVCVHAHTESHSRPHLSFRLRASFWQILQL